jgi:hypothetical protein
MKQRNPRNGCPRIAQQFNLAFGLDLDKEIVRRGLAAHYRPERRNQGTSWLATIGHTKDGLWSLDLFRCELILLKSYCIMVVMDRYTRRNIGFSVHTGAVDGPVLCRLLNNAMAGQPREVRISTDNDIIFRYRQWKANLSILDIDGIKSLSCSHVPSFC